VADLIANGLGKPWLPPKDIDIFVNYHPDLMALLQKEGFKSEPLASEPKLQELIPWGCRKITWPGTKYPIDLVLNKDSGERLCAFDYVNRLCWCDGNNFWATPQALDAIQANELRLHRLNTPVPTALRAYRFIRRYNSKIEDMTKKMIVRAISDEPGEFMRAIQNSEIPEAKETAFAVTTVFFNQHNQPLN
jgi:hypothetical protein